MKCDVCNSSVPTDEGHRIPAVAFRILLDRGFGIDPINLEMLTSGGMPRDQAMNLLRSEYLKSTSAWLLCSNCMRSARNALRQDTKFKLDPQQFELRKLPKQLSNTNGLIPIPAIIDLIVGEEIALYWFDRTPFIHDLGSIRPFQLLLKSGVYRSQSGPLMWLLFYVPNPQSTPQPFASVECYINPVDPQHVEIWRKLSNQTHWHLLLIGEDNEVVDVFEFENEFGLDEDLTTMKKQCRDMHVTDFMSAKEEFCKSHSLDDLCNLGE